LEKLKLGLKGRVGDGNRGEEFEGEEETRML
jgi:hypothetical protein